MAVPPYDAMLFPLLRVLSLHPRGLRAADAHEQLATLLELTSEDRGERLATGQPRYQNRSGWAHDRLKRRGLSSSASRGVWCLTESGARFFEKHREGLTDGALAWLTHPEATAVPMGTLPSVSPPPVRGDASSPDERIDGAVAEIQASVAAELLERLKGVPPVTFEKVVLDLLKAMGYGTTIEHEGRPGDGGIDGVINQDRLGLEKVCVQAKRWSNGTVGRPDLQAFQGAMSGRHFRKGVFITTSGFSREARDYAERVGIVAIDGVELARLMIEFGVGVSTIRTIRIVRVDSDFFDEGV